MRLIDWCDWFANPNSKTLAIKHSVPSADDSSAFFASLSTSRVTLASRLGRSSAEISQLMKPCVISSSTRAEIGACQWVEAWVIDVIDVIDWLIDWWIDWHTPSISLANDSAWSSTNRLKSTCFTSFDSFSSLACSNIDSKDWAFFLLNSYISGVAFWLWMEKIIDFFKIKVFSPCHWRSARISELISHFSTVEFAAYFRFDRLTFFVCEKGGKNINVWRKVRSSSVGGSKSSI